MDLKSGDLSSIPIEDIFHFRKNFKYDVVLERINYTYRVVNIYKDR